MAAADVSFSGFGRFGILYDEDADLETRIESRFRLDINASATADNGLEFSALVRMQADDDLDGDGTANTADPNGAQFGVAYEGLSVQVGNIGGAIAELPGVFEQSLGLSGLGFHNLAAKSASKGDSWDTYSSTGAGSNGVRVGYGMGDFSFIGSYSDLSNSGGEERISLGGAYTFNDWTVSLGWQDSTDDTDDRVQFIVIGDLGPASVTFKAADNDGAQKYVIGGDFDAGAATTVSAFFATDEEVDGDGGDSYGVGFVHDLGGGATIRGGVVDPWNDKLTADLGLQFNF
ncbi:porin, partial [Rhodosalinus sp.]|uniref:porin n=1 Tax=Rhodosalinus sp. TaxID=2047741 RepID=UPI00397E3159